LSCRWSKKIRSPAKRSASGCHGKWITTSNRTGRVRYPEIPVVFADSRKFAGEWTYRFLAAALADSMGSGVAR
jgi:hypothetical protein